MAAGVGGTRRVKLYSFTENLRWEDMGTGHVTMSYIDRLQGLTLVVSSEEDGSTLLESKITPDRAYQKQEETLIVWTEDDSCDLALSFQEKAGCDDIWSKICEVQGKDPSVDITQDLSEDGEMSPVNSEADIELPTPELSKLVDIYLKVMMAKPCQNLREKLAVAIEKESYIQKLIELFHMCEDLEDVGGLHTLYKIFRMFFLFNQPVLLNIMLQEEHIMDVIGILEYDPGKPQPVRHRQYLQQTSRHTEVIPFHSAELKNKIHHTYKIQYIQEVILPMPSLFEENMMSALNSLVLFNKTEIVNSLQENRVFMYNLFSQLNNESTSADRLRELSLLLRELCSFALALELEDGTKFYQKLCTYGLMPAMEQLLICEVEDVVVITVDILNHIGDYNSAILRNHILSQTESPDEDSQFLNLIIGLLVDAEFTSIDVQLVGLIKTLIDPENIMTETPTQAVVKTLFLNYFYKRCVHRLMAPLMAQTAGEVVSKDTSQCAMLLSHVLDLLSLCVERHSYHIRNYILKKDVLGRVLVLMTSSHGHLALAALRFCRRIIGLKEESYNQYVVKNNLLAPVVQAFLANGRKYNLLNSAIIEMFEFIKTENIKTLLKYVVETFMESLEGVDYVETFKTMKLRYEQEVDGNNKQAEAASQGGIIHNFLSRYHRDPRDLDEDEEAWFNDEEESTVNDNPSPVTSPTGASPRFPSPLAPLAAYSPRPATMPMSRMALPSRPSTTRTERVGDLPLEVFPPSFDGKERTYKPLHSLVDYDEDSDDEQPSDSSDGELSRDHSSSPAKRQKLENS